MSKAEKTKEKILEATKELVEEIGPDSITMEILAKKIGMGKASIYYHFKNKDEIITEVAKIEGRAIQREVYKAIQQKNDPKSKLLAFVTTRIKHVKKIAGFYGEDQLQKNLHKYYFAFEEFQRQFYDFEENLLFSILEDGMEKEIFDIENLRLTTSALLSGLRGIEYQWTFNASVDEAIGQAKLLLELLINGIKKR
ncbi:MAG: TetR/AcrR family transcriptional regulator [Fidelibacterota bacterium]